MSVHFLNLKTSECNGSPRKDREATPTKYDSNLRRDQIYKVYSLADFYPIIIYITIKLGNTGLFTKIFNMRLC